jgi:hypothetical protein
MLLGLLVLALLHILLLLFIVYALREPPFSAYAAAHTPG